MLELMDKTAGFAVMHTFGWIILCGAYPIVEP